MKTCEEYEGFELGPIRPPSEAQSLMLRITRNCPWNNCTFCGLYKGQKFSIRPVEHVIHDIDKIHGYHKSIYYFCTCQKLKAAHNYKLLMAS